MALCVQCYLLMDRVDRAEEQAKAMAAADDDATATQLAAAWVGCELGGAKVQEACYIYQELGDKYMWTVSCERCIRPRPRYPPLARAMRKQHAAVRGAAAHRRLTPHPPHPPQKNTSNTHTTTQHTKPPLHNGLAVCRMKMGEWEDAERDLLDALAKDPRHPDTLANLAVAAPRTGKSAARHLAQLRAVAPAHPAVLAARRQEEAFERAEQAVH